MKTHWVAGTLAIFAVSLLLACHRRAAGDLLTCPLTDIQYAQQIAAASDWDTLYALYKTDSPRCPTTAAQANYSRKVVSLFAQRWQDLPAFAQKAQKDPALVGFVYGHVNEQADTTSLKQLLLNAQTLCPAGASAFCEQLQWRAKAALIARGLST